MLKYINVKPMLKELIDVKLEKFVMDAIAKSKTKIDDAVGPIVYQAIEKEALEYIDNVDLEELLGVKEEKTA